MTYFRDNIEALKGYEPGFQPKQSDVVKLNTNENPFPPSPEVMKALGRITAERLRRYPDPMADEFRRAAAEIHGLAPENIMCSNGGDDLLTMAFRAFCDEARPVAYPVPTYSLYPVLARLQNCQAIEIPFDGEFNLPARLTKTNAALTVVCNPNAPTGSFVSVGELASLADELSGVLLIDEAYVDFAEDNCAALVKDFDNIIILRSLSKGYGLAGLRFGYAIAQSELIAGLIKIKDSYNVDAIAIALATAAIKDREYFRKTTDQVKKARDLLTARLRDLKFDVPASSTNFVFAESSACPASEIYEKLVQRNIYIRYFKLPGLENKLRITVGTTEQNERLISALKEIVRE
ncbi:MAG: histidinol-phosphate transaminase [Planctomycetes bacterium RBG_16_55_9]|nr:MAG: histidinol-phosphate transaminase [Planctomycetes bacterium RBG_16_55_9]